MGVGRLFEVDDGGDGALAVVVEGGVVGGVADGAVGGCPEGCASTSVEVYGAGASELAHEVGELGYGHPLGMAGVAAVDGEEDDVAVGSEAYCGAWMCVGGEGRCGLRWLLLQAVLEQDGAADEDCACGVGVGVFNCGAPWHDFQCAEGAADCSVASDGGFVGGGCVDYGFVFFEEACGVAVRHVEVGAVDGYGGMVGLCDVGGGAGGGADSDAGAEVPC